MSVEIRPIPPDDLRRWFESVYTAFGEDVSEEQWRHESLTIEAERVLGAYDGEALVGGGGAFSFQMTVPGGAVLPVAGVTLVGVMPTHRRQGVLRSLMRRQLADVRAAGEPMAALWASEGSIYQRFGYGLATLNASFDVERERAGFRTPLVAQGSIELRDVDAARPSIMRIYDDVRARTPGFYVRSGARWDALLADAEFVRRGASRRFNAVLTRGDADVGYALYRIRHDWTDSGPANTIQVLELLAADADAERQLWRYVLDVDLISRIRGRLGPADHPLLLMVAEPRRLQLRVGDGLWLRIVDVPAALEARSYAADGSIVLEVGDEFMPALAGRWRLTTGAGAGSVTATDEPADLALDIADLGAVYMGGFRFASLARAGRTVPLSADALRRADAMFATSEAPWCPEIF